jgi:hypothetical protein
MGNPEGLQFSGYWMSFSSSISPLEPKMLLSPTGLTTLVCPGHSERWLGAVWTTGGKEAEK